VLQFSVESSVVGLSPEAQENPYEGYTQPVTAASGEQVDAPAVNVAQQYPTIPPPTSVPVLHAMELLSGVAPPEQV
jgi:hypothetical protein